MNENDMAAKWHPLELHRLNNSRIKCTTSQNYNYKKMKCTHRTNLCVSHNMYITIFYTKNYHCFKQECTTPRYERLYYAVRM